MAIVDFMNTETGAEILEIIQRCCPAKTSGNILRWQFLLLICHFGLQQIDQDMFRQPELTGSEPYKRCTGGEGFIWGRSMETTNQLNQKQNIYGVFNDYTCTDERGTVTVWNWAVNKEVQMVTPDMIQPIVCTAIDCFQYLPEEWRNRLREQRYEVGEKANCPVYSMAEFEILQSKMEAFMQTIREYHKEILQDSEEIITDMAPSEIKKSASAAGRHIYGLEGLVCLGDVLVKNGWLTPAEEEDCKPGLLIVAHPERCNL